MKDVKEKVKLALIENVKQIFQMMLFTDPIPKEPKETVDKDFSGITAIIGMAGENGSSVLYLRCSDESACKLASKMLGAEYTEVNDEVKDAIGEIANMIAGNLKAVLSDFGVELELSIPTLISGEKYETKLGEDEGEDVHRLAVPFEFDGGEMEVILIISSEMIARLEEMWW